jgi:C4-dicarboxylate transporter, DctQ subunit
MNAISALRAGFERIMEIVVVLLVASLALLVIAGFVFRYLGAPLIWYDELASIGLAWLTYFGSALAAAKGAHIACPGVVNALSPTWRVPIAIFAELCVIGFFVLLAVTGIQVLLVLDGLTMISLPSISLQLTQAVIPIGAVLFIIGELLRFPEVLAQARGKGFLDHELEEALEEAAHVQPRGVLAREK